MVVGQWKTSKFGEFKKIKINPWLERLGAE